MDPLASPKSKLHSFSLRPNRVIIGFHLAACNGQWHKLFSGLTISSKPNRFWCFFFRYQPQQGQTIGRVGDKLRPCQASGSEDLGHGLRAWPGRHHPDLGQAASRHPRPSSVFWARDHGPQDRGCLEVDWLTRVRTRIGNLSSWPLSDLTEIVPSRLTWWLSL